MTDPIDLSQMPIVLGGEQPERQPPEFRVSQIPAGAKLYVGKPDGDGWQYVGETAGPVTFES